ncbi:MAG: HigA family addiction module antidote protein [Verrucomicrobia bacterium]|jgi:antitoxin HigA-1|nr:HigA family addiction module antidote protein [Verrucomicrobiota bacterium]
MQTLTPIGPAANTPGEILRTEFLEPLGLSQNQLAIKSGLDRMRISEIVRGQRRITPQTAMAFDKVFQTGAQFWLNLQTDYDLAVEAKKRRAKARSGSLVQKVSGILKAPAPKAEHIPAYKKKSGVYGNRSKSAGKRSRK